MNIQVKDFEADTASFHVACSNCSSLIGIKVVGPRDQDSLYYLPQSKFKIKPYKLSVSLFSTSDKLLGKFSEEIDIACAKLCLPCTVAKTKVKKSQLKSAAFKDESDVSVIVHKNEGRLLLTDENGLYDALIRQQFAAKRRLSSADGNLLLVIYDETISDSFLDCDTDNMSFYDMLLQHSTIDTLTGPGRQPLVGALSKHFKLMFLDRDNVDAQRAHLVNFLYR